MTRNYGAELANVRVAGNRVQINNFSFAVNINIFWLLVLLSTLQAPAKAMIRALIMKELNILLHVAWLIFLWFSNWLDNNKKITLIYFFVIVIYYFICHIETARSIVGFMCVWVVDADFFNFFVLFFADAASNVECISSCECELP